MTSNNCQDDYENVFIGFLVEWKKSYCASSLWQGYSCIKKYLMVKNNVNTSSYLIVKEFLKKEAKNHVSKQSCVFEMGDIIKYSMIADLKSIELLYLVVMVVGVFRTQIKFSFYQKLYLNYTP
jgi:hypothetical protein